MKNRWRSVCALVRSVSGFGVLSTVALSAFIADAHAAEHHSIVIVTGQSNARQLFAQGVMNGLLASGEMSDAVLYHRHHSGNWLNRWIDGVPGEHQLRENFLDDFWNGDGTAGLQQTIDAIESSGDTWSIDGFVWFQGEGDSGSPFNRSVYRSRFEYMIASIEAAFEMPNSLRVVVTKIDFNGDEPALFEIGGRTPEDIEALRLIQQEIADADPARNAVDSRGWHRFDVWHIGDFNDPRGLYGLVEDFGESFATPYLNTQIGANRADLNRDGILDLADIGAFVDGFASQSIKSDLAVPVGVFDLADVSVFVGLFTQP